jgi:FAD:protein FMN transferase
VRQMSETADGAIRPICLSRRRFLSVTAAVAGAGALGIATGRHPRAAETIVWHGVALGAPATIRLHGPDRAMAEASLECALAELKRQELIFSLYRAESALSRLNRTGRIDHPPFDLVRLLSQSQVISRATDGTFDPTVQPLWELFARHFAKNPNDAQGPPQAARAAALAHVDYRQVRLSSEEISFTRPGMALTLNGIAQGYITDRIVEILRRDGFDNFVADLGEPRAVGTHPSGRPWRIKLLTPGPGGQSAREIDVIDQAVATSAPQGTRFDDRGRFHHLFDPRNGTCASLHEAVTVVAPTAALADGLSTAFAVMKRDEIARVAAQFLDVRAFVI